MKKLIVFILSAFLIFTVSTHQAEASTKWGKIEIQKGMIGKVQILKDTDLYTLSKGKLKFVKKLKKGNEHGVYGETKNMGGLYKLSGINYVKKSSSIKYLKVPVVPVTYGKVKGVVTWQYNNYIGTKPDVGADVILFPVNNKPVKAEQILAVMDEKIEASSLGIYFANVDGYGAYEFNKIPAGNYVGMYISVKTFRNYMTPVDSTVLKQLKPYVYNIEPNDFGIGMFNHMVINIEVKTNETKIISKDWGYSY